MVDRMQIAGDFGRYLNIEKAVTIYYPKANPGGIRHQCRVYGQSSYSEYFGPQ
jgi:hypothetical protein